MQDLDQLERISRRYWYDKATMDAIASEEGVSRSTISRTLDAARSAGVVTVQVNSLHGRATSLARSLTEELGVATTVVAAPDHASADEKLRLVASATGDLLEQCMQPGMIIGVAWGTTTSAVGDHLTPRPLSDVQIVQLNGAMNTHSSGVGYGSDVLGRFAAAWTGQIHHFPVPAFFDHAETRDAMWRERSVQRVLQLQHAADVALFGVGAVAGAVPSRVYTEGYLTGRDRAELASQGVVGDVCTVFLRSDGSWQGISINRRSSGVAPPTLQRIPRRVCAATGANKYLALEAALAAGVITDLVIDDATATALLARRRGRRPRT